MKRRTLYFTAPREVGLRTSTFAPAADEVVVETRLSAVNAGTELLLYRGEAPADLPADETLDALEGDLSYPLRYGYAAVGDVVSTGEAVSDEWTDRAVFAFNPHESRFATSPDALVPVPGDVSPAAATMLPSAETATSLVLDGRPRVGERVVVFGAGVIGLCTVDLLADFPLDRLVAVDPLDDRRDRALAMGADVAVPPAEVETALDPADPEGADLVYELSGDPAALDDAVGVTGYDSRVVVGSWYGTKRATLDLGRGFHRDRVTVESSQVSTLAPESRGRWTKNRRLEAAFDRLRGIDAESLVTHRVPFDDAPEAYRLLDDRPGAESPLQVLLTYR
jgi:2-desacetyl-2-hydroxyethyl bacteriochlorophyllide A dehydrogenase